ncbi:hypothetical protein HY631_02535 [Candidatus Uhrbacteria bacterium]|nr:hypothetical protein [Candidatus Uhrbacteria bacterium]
MSVKSKPKGFRVLKRIRRPRHSKKLAEFIGVIAGDGHIAPYQILMTTNSKTDLEHARFVGKLGEELFGVRPRIHKRKDENSVTVIFSAKSMAECVHQFGIPTGKKINNSLSVPTWVLGSDSYKRAFLRGLFDTDGCLFLDRHRIKDKLYRHIGWTITSASQDFRKQIMLLLRNLGFSPTCRPSQHAVFLRRQHEITRYFNVLGSSNQKHLNRYVRFRKHR